MTDLQVNKDERQTNRDWLKANAVKHYGEWVALCHGELIASGQTVAELKGHLDDTSGVLITRVL